MKVLITGAFGSLGTNVLERLLKTEHEITCFVTKRKASRKKAKKYTQVCRVFFGDIRNLSEVKTAVEGQDVVLHLAAIVPPRINYEDPNYAYEVNVNGTANVLQAIKESNNHAKLIYISSVAVFGDTRARGACVLGPEEPVNPNKDDLYAQQKVESEKMIMQFGVTWSILRFGFMPNFDKKMKLDPMLFEVPLDTNMELLHIKDAAKAVVTALEKEEIWHKILHIAGGEKCRVTYKEFITAMFEALGIGTLPDSAFGTKDFHCVFFDTDYSQQLLQYQQRTFEDLIAEFREKNRKLLPWIKLFRPLIRKWILKQSPYYKTNE
ncbi:MAG: NAD-dependent epimerase/dehydratase family protein [Candidatus Heimdallarchaeota archaeon]